MSHSSSLAMDWNQGELGHGSPQRTAPRLRAVAPSLAPQPGMALVRGTAFDQNLRLLLGALSERVWRLELPEPLDLALPAESLTKRLFREARLVECHSAKSGQGAKATSPDCIGMTLAELIIATPDEHQAIFERFVAGHYRFMDQPSLEWDEEGRPLRVLTNLVGIVENGLMVGLWGVQRSATVGKPLSPTPRPLAQSQASAMCISDALGNIMFESPELEQLLGGSTSSRKGLKWCDMVHEEDRAAMTAAFEANVREPQHAAVVSVARLRRSDGGWLRRAILCQPMTEVPGPALISIGIRPLPEDDPKTPRRRRAAPKATARMTTQVCTLNNILALISGHAQLANMLEHVDPETQRHLAVIVEAAERASATLGNIVS